MDTIQCALLSVKLRHYATYTAQRQANAAHYTEELLKLPGVVQAGPADGGCGASQSGAENADGARLILPVCFSGNTHIWNQYTIRVIGSGQRDALRDHLQKLGIGCEIYYPLTLDQQPCFAHLPESSRAGCTVSHRMAQEVLSLPIYGELTEAQRNEVIAAIAAWLR